MKNFFIMAPVRFSTFLRYISLKIFFLNIPFVLSAPTGITEVTSPRDVFFVAAVLRHLQNKKAVEQGISQNFSAYRGEVKYSKYTPHFKTFEGIV